MFVTDDDYAVVVGDDALRVLSRASEALRLNAETAALEEIAGYLRPDYDTEAAFAAVFEERNAKLVMVTADIALYHMASALPQKMGMEIRKERYDSAIKWLEAVSAGKIVPDLPRAGEGDATSVGIGTEYSCEPRLRHNW